MAQQINVFGTNLIIPGSVVQTTVQNAVSGLAVTGVLMIVGESDMGPSYADETDIDDVTYGPDQQADVLAKYGQGRIVDAFRGAVAAADDPQISGSFNRIIIGKTNQGAKASGLLDKIGSGTYGTLYDKSYGKAGNLINYTIVQDTAEVGPSTGSFSYIPNAGTVNAELRVNGGAVAALSLVADTQPNAFVTAVTALTGVDASGGVNRNAIAVSGTLAVDANPGGAGANVVLITRSVAWAVTPSVGDTLIIPNASVIDGGGGNENIGGYVITAVTSTTITATKLSDAGKPGAVPGTITAPIDVAAAAIAAVTDLSAWSPVIIFSAPTSVIDGIGKTLEINQLATGTDLLQRQAFVLGTTSAVSWISKSGSPALLESSAEYGVNVDIARQSDQVNNNFDVQGKVALNIGYSGTSCALVIDDETLTTTVVGGSGANLSLDLSDYATVGDLATFINAQAGYTAAAENAALAQYSPVWLDDVTTTAGSNFGSQTARIKVDAYLFFKALSENTALVQLGNPAAQALSGLPAANTIRFLSGGLLGSTSDANVQGAIDFMESARGNFLIPLFSRDASEDIDDDETDPASSYTIDAINAYAKTHVLAMSTVKRKRNRQAFCSKQDTFAVVQDSAADLASARCSLVFQDFKDVGLQGIEQFQPWMGAIKAAGMQAAGFYRAIFNKGINCSGILQNAGDFNDTNDSQMENALISGLLPAKRREQGGFTWVSDQTTYTRDNNPVFNSIQAIYDADTVALTIAQRMEQAFLGQSLADVSAALALSALGGICFDLLRQKLLAASDAAPGGFKDAAIRIVGPVMYVDLTVFLATALYFIPISLQVQQVTQSASG